MRLTLLALACTLALAGCASTGVGGGGSGELQASCAHKVGDLCGLGPSGRQNKR